MSKPNKKLTAQDKRDRQAIAAINNGVIDLISLINEAEQNTGYSFPEEHAHALHQMQRDMYNKLREI